MARCPDCAPQTYGGHKLTVRKSAHLHLWYVECTCGWEPDRLPGSGRYGRPTWDLAMHTGQAHQMKEMKA